jgi:hypothetical protein
VLLKGYLHGRKHFLASIIFVALTLFGQATFAERPGFAQRPAEAGIPAHLREAFANRFENSERIQKAIDAQHRHATALLNLSGVVGTAVGWSENDQAVVKVYLETSASSAGLPESIDGIPLVIERTGKVYALNFDCKQSGTCESEYVAQATAGSEPASQTDWHERPVPIGVSISKAPGTEAGTLACRVSSGCHTYALSNAHVLLGPDLVAPSVTNILQPGKYDGGIYPDDTIGHVYSTVPIVFSTKPNTNNRVDAGLVDLNVSSVGVATRSDGYGAPRNEPIAPYVGLNVKKYGRTTALTHGYIDAINAMINVTYGPNVALFKGQIIIRGNGGSNFSISGDSGSLVVASGGADDRRPVGLIFAAGVDGTNAPISVANNIEEVLTLLGVTMDGVP